MILEKYLTLWKWGTEQDKKNCENLLLQKTSSMYVCIMWWQTKKNLYYIRIRKNEVKIIRRIIKHREKLLNKLKNVQKLVYENEPDLGQKWKQIKYCWNWRKYHSGLNIV